MRTSLLAGLTTRGTSFLAAGAATALAGLLLGEREPAERRRGPDRAAAARALAAGRRPYRLSCTRVISPPRVPAGQTAR